jgi:prepilin-type processing-associated H-X9-DG protein
MKLERGLTREDVAVVLACGTLALLSIGAVGMQGRSRAKQAACLINLRQLSRAWLMYKDDNDGLLVGGDTRRSYDWVLGSQSGNTTEQNRQAIRSGALFPYVDNINIYHCPAEVRPNQYGEFRVRSFSIAGGANGEQWSEYNAALRYHELNNPGARYVFVEQIDPRAVNIGSWQMYPKTKAWVAPLAIWHHRKTNMGYADGHAETRVWVNESTMYWLWKATYDPVNFTFCIRPPADEQEDVEFMASRFPYKSLE